ncbi:ribosome maturation factor RimM [Lewinella sp. 4G2]|uniref:ribosome maturation factor RimM n=1 Tax=Lewinella sp. 4G2 TaxID=1803372 RepID=UPI0007B473F0|nr:ribosome maturation factor RimM [Lewinella sp. 4G2]OAV45547.1 16S rRNA processing protein RimM [Lewinella sp. 4G2]
MNLIEIGWLGKAHGLKGEIKAHVSDFYEDDLFRATSIHVGDPAVPYFLEQVRAGGSVILKIEELDNREQVALLSNRPLFLMDSQVEEKEAEGADTPFDALIGYRIQAEGYPLLGPITGIMDLPSHYLAELTHDGREILVPLHEDLVVSVDEEEKILGMALPEGLVSASDGED